MSLWPSISHLPPTAIGWTAKAAHPSKPCWTTSALAGRTYTSAGQVASVLHSMKVLQVFQAKLLQCMDKAGPDPAAFRELHSTTDLALCATKTTDIGDRQAHGQPSGAWAPPVVDAGGDQGWGQGSLPGLTSLPHWPVRTCCGRVRRTLHCGTEVVPGNATLPAKALQLCSWLELPQICAEPSACQDSNTGYPARTQTCEIDLIRLDTASLILQDPAPKKSSWFTGQEEGGAKSHGCRTNSQAASGEPPSTPFSSRC